MLKYIYALLTVGIFGFLSYSVIVGPVDIGGRRGRTLTEISNWLSETLTPYGAAAVLAITGLVIAYLILRPSSEE